MIPRPVTRDNSAILSYSMTLVGNTGQPSTKNGEEGEIMGEGREEEGNKGE